MKEWWSHCIVSQCFTQILCTLSSDLIAVKVECSECLYERDRNEMMVKTWRSDNLTVLCRNASPKYCAPWAPILLPRRLSVVSVCIKETGMSEWRRIWWNVVYSDKGWISAYTSVLLVRQESNASDFTGKCSEWMCKLYGGVSGKYRCAWWVPSSECVSEDVSFFWELWGNLLTSDEWILIVELYDCYSNVELYCIFNCWRLVHHPIPRMA